MREHIEMDGYTKAQLTDEYFKKKTKASPQKKKPKANRALFHTVFSSH